MTATMERDTGGPASDQALITLAAPALAEAAAPDEVVVVPWGRVDSTAGSFVVDAESGAAVVAAFAAHGADLPIDYEHQTLGGAYASPNGTAPAAGWITALSARPEVGIVGRVNWTEAGRRLLMEKAYRYLSPVAIIRKADRKLVALHSVALTNKPAIVGLRAIVNCAAGAEGGAEAEVALQMAALSARLDVPADAEVAAVLAAAVARIDALEANIRQAEAEEAVAALAEAGKLTAAQRAWALSLALTDRASFDAWAQTAPVVVTLGRTEPPGGGAAEGTEAIAARARGEYRAHRALQQLTSEEAYVAAARRDLAAALEV